MRHEPAVLALSRQPLPTLDRTRYAPTSGVARGAYVLAVAHGGNPEVILIATGSEVSLAVEAHEKLLAEGIGSRVVSMPSWDIFDHQAQEYQDIVLPPSVNARVVIEGGFDLQMGALCRQVRPHHRHEDIRRLGVTQRTPEALRIRASPRPCSSQRTTSSELEAQANGEISNLRDKNPVL